MLFLIATGISETWLIGMDKTIVLQKALIGAGMGMMFGGLGSAMIPPLVRRLKNHGLIH